MTVWPLERKWSCSLSDTPKEETSLRTGELADKPVLVLLGAAGTGKTFELSQMMAADLARGKDVRHGRLAPLACRAQGLAEELKQLSDGVGPNTVIYLDSLDESMIPDRFAALTLAEWIRSTLHATKPMLRIACRSAVWPQAVVHALRDTYGPSNTMTAILQPMGEKDIQRAAVAEGMDAEKLLAEIARTGSLALSQHPLTLKMLFSVFRGIGTLPSNRSELFERGVRSLGTEREERRGVRTDGDVPAEEILEIAHWVACITLLSGRDIVDLKDDAEPGAVGLSELTSLNSFNSLLTTRRIEALAASGLCEGQGNRQFRFGHRQFAEYLAGRTLGRLLPHQARSLLESGLGWTHGVASPLRETAAFAAQENHGIAEWIADSDPFVIGQSCVVDDKLRRQATLALIKKFRAHQLTDSQIRANASDFPGLKYPDAATDLAPVLRERGADAEDVLEFAVSLVKDWGLSELSDELADLMLDAAAPEHPRVAAGHALVKMGTPAAKLRLKPLIGGSGPDPHRQLHGLALRCNWPENLTDTELLAALPPRESRSFTGAYESFLFDLDSQGFQADNDRAAGLRWATSRLRRGEDYDPAVRTAKRIARAALSDLADPVILERLATLMLEASRGYFSSPLGLIRNTRFRNDALEETPDEPPLKGRTDERRALLGEMVRLADPRDHLGWAARETPHLLEKEDFPWLLGRALDASCPGPARTHYAELARVVFRIDDLACVEAWLAVHDQEPVRSVLNIPTVVELDSRAARDAKRDWLEQFTYSRPEKPKLLTPSPKERIADILGRCETNDFRCFHSLCMELTLEDTSTHYECDRFLTRTAGWKQSDSDTKKRIVAAARQFLERDTESVKRAQSADFNLIQQSGMAAFWLIEHEGQVDFLTEEWWNKWAWYIMRELHPNLFGEPEEPKLISIRLLLSPAPLQVRSHMLRLACDVDVTSKDLFQSLLALMREVEDAPLDGALAGLIAAGTVAPDRLGHAADHVLRKGGKSASEACMSRLRVVADEAVVSTEHASVALAVALLSNADSEYWDQVLALLETRPDLRRLALGAYAYSERWRHLGREGDSSKKHTTPKQMGVLVRQLFLAFPPETDPERDGACSVGQDDSGRDLRNRVLSALGDTAHIHAVEALRSLEREFGSKYPWLRRPRARAEREYRQTRWNAVPPESVARILSDGESRLVRTPEDVVDGIVEAIKQYSISLRSASPSPLEDLWNTPTGVGPSPKLEERASDKLCEAIERYFKFRAVTAGRELQIRRRLIEKDAGGESGSRVDVFVKVPATGTVKGKPIEVPVEVKRSCNEDVKTSLKVQLVDRYMSEVNADAGVYVVMWFAAPNMARGFTPKWPDIETAQRELTEQAEAESKSGVTVRAIVVDCSLR